MNKNRILISFALIGAFFFLTSQTTNEPILTKQKDITIINTTSLATDIEGYVAQTPVKVYIQGDKVLRIEALENEETPKYFDMVVKGLLKKWNGKPVKVAEKQKVDVVTGATVSSEAVIENVRRGISYYIYANKKK
ncbi:MAG: FMN-binding protein [Bacteroidaceae bacterium]|nr:FMN-binding protein [Bacteroidaceae bacterium]